MVWNHTYTKQVNLRFSYHSVSILRPRQDGWHCADDSFKCIFLNENILISIQISLKFVHKSPINNIPALVQIMAWRRPGDEPLSEPMMVSFPTHICVTRPEWVNKCRGLANCSCQVLSDHKTQFSCCFPNQFLMWCNTQSSDLRLNSGVALHTRS